MTGQKALQRIVDLAPAKVLDVGSGDGEHARAMRDAGLDVTTLDHHRDADIQAEWPVTLDRMYDAVWCAHTLEHSPNPGAFIQAMIAACKPSGWLAITVPPMKPNLAGGHMTLWTPGLLVYHMVMAGIDCRDAMVSTYQYNISVIVRNVKRPDLPLQHDRGDLEQLSEFFPWPVEQGMEHFPDVHWEGSPPLLADHPNHGTAVLWPYKFRDMKTGWREKFLWLVAALRHHGYDVKRHPNLICGGLEDLDVYVPARDNPAELCIYNHATQANLQGNILKADRNWFWKPSGPTHDHATLDELGYGPYSSIGYERPRYSEMDGGRVNAFLADEVAGWIASRTCKWQDALAKEQQPTSTDYHLVLGQCTGDSVNTIMDFGNYVDKLLAVVRELVRVDPGREIVVKLHPYMAGQDFSQPEFVDVVQRQLSEIGPQVSIVTGLCSVHPYLAPARDVILANSGAGVEALMHGKPVIAWGSPEYHWVAYDLRHLCDLQRALRLDWHDAHAAYQWLYWYCKRHTIYDAASAIRRVGELLDAG